MIQLNSIFTNSLPGGRSSELSLSPHEITIPTGTILGVTSPNAASKATPHYLRSDYILIPKSQSLKSPSPENRPQIDILKGSKLLRWDYNASGGKWTVLDDNMTEDYVLILKNKAENPRPTSSQTAQKVHQRSSGAQPQDLQAIVPKTQWGGAPFSQLKPEIQRLINEHGGNSVKSRDAIHRLLALPESQRAKMELNHSQRLPYSYTKDQYERGVHFVRSLTSSSVMSPATVDISHEPSDYPGWALGGQRINIAPTTMDVDRVLAHELGHIVEARSSSVRGKIIAFQNSRITRPWAWKLPPGLCYRTSQIAQGNRHEILAVGIEAIFYDPVRFFQLDPEFFGGIVDILRGIDGAGTSGTSYPQNGYGRSYYSKSNYVAMRV